MKYIIFLILLASCGTPVISECYSCTNTPTDSCTSTCQTKCDIYGTKMVKIIRYEKAFQVRTKGYPALKSFKSENGLSNYATNAYTYNINLELKPLIGLLEKELGIKLKCE